MKRTDFGVNITDHVTTVTVVSLLGNVVVDSNQLWTGTGQRVWRVGRSCRFHWWIIVSCVTCILIRCALFWYEFGLNCAPFRFGCYSRALWFRNLIDSGHCCHSWEKVRHGTCQKCSKCQYLYIKKPTYCNGGGGMKHVNIKIRQTYKLYNKCFSPFTFLLFSTLFYNNFSTFFNSKGGGGCYNVLLTPSGSAS